MTQAPKVYDVKAFCELFGISRSMFYKLLKEDQGPRIFKIGKRTLISGQAVADWQARLES